MNINRDQVDRIKKRYPTGTRIELISAMDDIQGVEIKVNNMLTVTNS